MAPGLPVPSDEATDVEMIGHAGTAAGWTLLGASRRGRLHAHRGDHREDALAQSAWRDGWCAAVADGAGSAPWSRLGAAIATHVVVRAIADALASGQPIGQALEAGARAVDAAMQAFRGHTGLSSRDLRTTLLVTCCDGRRLGLLQVGDGAQVLVRADGTVVRPHAGDSGDFSGEVTHFLPDDGALEQLLRSAVVHDATDVHGLLMVSDGIEDPYYPMARHAPALFAQLTRPVPGGDAGAVAGVVPTVPGPVLGAADAVARLGTWLGFEKRGENDDRTLFIARQDAVAWASPWAPSPSA